MKNLHQPTNGYGTYILHILREQCVKQPQYVMCAAAETLFISTVLDVKCVECCLCIVAFSVILMPHDLAAF